ncbi:MAG: aminopeptidase P family protein [Rhodospirillales bacterium]|nr:aminopeptidase P family protein [Rhodospirillales bacterium]MBO6785428.1 aminopeptidase P family protein [Rhodospirillales bacterium]
MALHFSEAELAVRRDRTCEAMADAGLDGMLIFRQESMYYLTGYDTFGYVFFQCLYLGSDGRMMLLTRAPDLRQAQNTSVIEDIRIWVDKPDAGPAEELRGILEEFGCKGRRLGVEYEAYGLTARNGKRLDAALDGFCVLEDASELISRLRVVKSPAEIEYVRQAAALADDALDAAIATAAPGVSESDILAAMQGAVFKGGGDYPGNPFIIGSAEDALLCRTKSGRRTLDTNDQLNLEWAGTYLHYHAAMFRTMVFGDMPDRQKQMYDVAYEALMAVEDALRPGNIVGDAFQAYADVIDRAGMKEHRLNACGYSLGTTFQPNWMDWPMLYADNPVEIEPGMVYFCHMIIFDSDAQLAMCLGETVLTTSGAAERLSRSPLDLIHKA